MMLDWPLSTHVQDSAVPMVRLIPIGVVERVRITYAEE